MALGNVDLTDPSSLAASLAALAPVVLGGVTTYLNIFIESQKELRSRISLRRETLIEKVASAHAMLLNHARKIEDDNVLRGDGHGEPDLVGDYADEMFRLFTVFHRLELLKLVVKAAYYILFFTIALGLAGLMLSLLSDSLRACVLWYGITAVFTQIIVIFVVLLASGKLEQYEDVT